MCFGQSAGRGPLVFPEFLTLLCRPAHMRTVHFHKGVAVVPTGGSNGRVLMCARMCSLNSEKDPAELLVGCHRALFLEATNGSKTSDHAAPLVRSEVQVCELLVLQIIVNQW